MFDKPGFLRISHFQLHKLRPSFCTRLLSTVLPYPYTKENLRIVLEDMVNDMNNLYETGVTASWFKDSYAIFQVRHVINPNSHFPAPIRIDLISDRLFHSGEMG